MQARDISCAAQATAAQARQEFAVRLHAGKGATPPHKLFYVVRREMQRMSGGKAAPAGSGCWGRGCKESWLGRHATHAMPPCSALRELSAHCCSHAFKNGPGQHFWTACQSTHQRQKYKRAGQGCSPHCYSELQVPPAVHPGNAGLVHNSIGGREAWRDVPPNPLFFLALLDRQKRTPRRAWQRPAPRIDIH